MNAKQTSDEREKKSDGGVIALHALPVGILGSRWSEIFDQSGFDSNLIGVICEKVFVASARRVRRWKYVQEHPFSVAEWVRTAVLLRV